MDLKEGYCVIEIRYPDGSEVQCVTTLNQKILERTGLQFIDGLVDFSCRKEIPPELLIENEVSLHKGNQLTLSNLDKLFLNGIKEGWA